MAAPALGGCKSSDGAADGAPDEGETQGQVDCGAILTLPPIVQVFDQASGEAICDPAFTLLGGPDGAASNGVGAVDCATAAQGGCPAPADSGTRWCAFALVALNPGGHYTVQVSKVGYQPVTVDDVVPGTGGCVPEVPASHHQVSLVRIPLAAPR
jgi:hypothetical protein